MHADRVNRALLARARHVHVSSYFLQTGLMPGLRGLLETARAGGAGATTSLDPNWDPSGQWNSGLRELLSQVDVLAPNKVEACRIAGRETAEDAARDLSKSGPLVAVKLGAAGALAAPPDGPLIHAPAPAGIEPVDAVGAGDAFDAGLLAGLLSGEPLEHALALGCACGTLSTRAAGGTAAQPTLAEARAARVRPNASRSMRPY
jgi:sugar/nucleoside kinase (ribokinase family)